MSAIVTPADRELAVELTPDIGHPLIDHVARCECVAKKIAEWRSKLTPSPWISSSHSLPTHFYSVLGWVTGGPLVYGDPFVDLVSYDPVRNEWHQSLGLEDAIVPVSHWMPIPEVPTK